VSAAPASTRLRDLARPAGERAAGAALACELCGAPIPERHRHVLDLDSREPQCACRACALLFDRDQAGGGHYRLIPERRVALERFVFEERLFASLGIPVDLAFLCVESRSGQVLARYPGALGTIASTPAPDAWQQVLAANPALADMQADVEALLLSRARGARDAWIVSIEDCYRLAARVRESWRGFSGGEQVWIEIAGFFTELRAEREEPPWR
jgi:hypothetical protein